MAADGESVRVIETSNSFLLSIRRLAAPMLLSVLAACGGGSSSVEPLQSADSMVDDLAIAQSVYDAQRRTPPGFLSDPTDYPGLSEFRFHVVAQDVGLAAATDMRFEACTDDPVTAEVWSAQASAARGLTSTMTTTRDTEWFFQVDRVLDSDPTAVAVVRVFRCAALDRGTLDDAGSAGQLNRAPVTADDLRFVSEYLWQFSIFNNALQAVISSRAATGDGVLNHDLVRAATQVGAGVNGCDRIDLYRWRHSVDLSDGTLTEETVWLRSFDAEQTGGNVSLCPQ
ncbi:MAG: hypothetical protein AAF578_01590 [Pseudomonadota bacterium]